MKIWIINHYALPPRGAGGTRHYSLARELQSRGHEVLVIGANYNHFSHELIPSSGKIGELDTSCDVPFLWIPVRAYQGNSPRRLLNMMDFVFGLLRNKYLRSKASPDVIIGSSPHLFAAFAAFRLARRLKKPFVLEVRDIWPESLTDLGRISKKHPLILIMKWIELYLYRHADRVITLLPNSKDYLVSCGVPASNILWLPNSVNILPPKNNKVRDKQDKKFTVMYAGAHGLANDLETVVKAAKILHEMGKDQKIRIMLVGDGPEKTRLQEMVSSENTGIIEFMNPVPKQKIYDVMDQADAFIMLLKKSPVFRWGISPNKLFDYMMMARPVIFGVETPVDPVRISDSGISIPSGDPGVLANAICQLAGLSEKTRLEMGERGRKYVTQHHDVRLLAVSLEQFIMV